MAVTNEEKQFLTQGLSEGSHHCLSPLMAPTKRVCVLTTRADGMIEATGLNYQPVAAPSRTDIGAMVNAVHVGFTHIISSLGEESLADIFILNKIDVGEGPRQ